MGRVPLDSATIEGVFPVIWPRTPGHEVVGKVDAPGANVRGFQLGQRVGVEFLGGPCGYCDGGAKLIVATSSEGDSVAATFNGLRPGGTSIALGVGSQISTSSLHLVFGEGATRFADRQPRNG